MRVFTEKQADKWEIIGEKRCGTYWFHTNKNGEYYGSQYFKRFAEYYDKGRPRHNLFHKTGFPFEAYCVMAGYRSANCFMQEMER